MAQTATTSHHRPMPDLAIHLTAGIIGEVGSTDGSIGFALWARGCATRLSHDPG
jgi:hypothetical protein